MQGKVQSRLNNCLTSLSREIAIMERDRVMKSMMSNVGMDALRKDPSDRFALRLATRGNSTPLKYRFYDFVKQYLSEKNLEDGRRYAQENSEKVFQFKCRSLH